MKKFYEMFRFGLFALLLGSMVFMTACDKKSSDKDLDDEEEIEKIENGKAPKSVAGMTLKIYNSLGEHVWTIDFQSNKSATVQRLFSYDEPAPNIATYSKTDDDSAVLYMSYNEEQSFKEFALAFETPNNGSAIPTNTGKVMSFTLFETKSK